MSEIGGNGYLADVNQINQNLANFRGMKQEARIEQQKIDLQAKQENDLNDLRKVGSGLTEKAFKDFVTKYGGKAWNYKGFNGKGLVEDEETGELVEGDVKKSLADLDSDLGDSIMRGGKKLVGRLGQTLRSKISGVGGDQLSVDNPSLNQMDNVRSAEPAELNDEAEVEDGFGKAGLEDIPEYKGGDFASFLQDQKALLEPSVQTQRVSQVEVEEPAPEVKPQLEVNNPSNAVQKEGGLGEHDPEDLDKALDDNVSPEEFQAHLDSKYNFKSGAEGEAGEAGDIAGEAGDVAGDVAEAGAGIAEATTAEEVGGGLEVAGTALEATGILAPFGFLLQALGVGADAFGAYEAGKGVVDAFENDVLGQKTYKTPTIVTPVQPKTLLSQHMLITPTSDTLHNPASGLASGW